MSDLREILVIGGTGAQGGPVVQGNTAIPILITLARSQRYRVRVLTRDTQSPRAQALLQLPNVHLIQGNQDNQADLHAAFRGVYGAWVNTDGFSIGEKAELFYGIRAYEIARHENVQHYVYANVDYTLKVAGWNEAYHVGHNDAKARVGDFILAQGQEGAMKSSLITTPPYMDMLLDGMFVPKEQDDGSFVWANPASTSSLYANWLRSQSALQLLAANELCLLLEDGKIPLIALDDVGAYSLWLFDHFPESAGLNLEVATDEVTFAEIAKTFSEFTGKRGVHVYKPLEDYLAGAEPYPGAYSNFMVDPSMPRDESFQTWRENFSAWWRYWGEGHGVKRDFDLLTKIHPNRIKGLREWMEKVHYDGKPRQVLKGPDDLKRKMGGA
ncbi:NmrA-like protein [Macrophomina phaseolina MS6]|uniref:NmrA-like protein n=1 Tax=Macrophomina phaseolina (strain MS6) TaxID=1126212 RepID=K2RNN0_MACPH|nr:NmrA-like protein [Macrophomina phaseolina MS6]